MFKFSSLVVGIFLTVVVSAAANKDVHVMADEVSVISESNADKVIPVVQTIGGVATTFFYTIIDEQTIVNDDQSSLISGGNTFFFFLSNCNNNFNILNQHSG